MTSNTIEFATPFVVFFGDINEESWGKTGLGLVHWRPEACVGQVRLPGCGVDAGVPDLSVAAAKSAGAMGKAPPQFQQKAGDMLDSAAQPAA